MERTVHTVQTIIIPINKKKIDFFCIFKLMHIHIDKKMQHEKKLEKKKAKLIRHTNFDLYEK